MICKFVDSIVAAPTTRFDFFRAAQGVMLLAQGTRIGMPSLDRSMTQSALTDGFVVGSSSYGHRVLSLRVRFAAANVDTVATQMQLLNRELDRETNFLMWQPTGATKPVFFKTYRSAPVEVDMELATTSGWECQVEILADPFALGLREALGPFTVNNDPAAGSNGLFFDVTGVIGDVPAPAVIQDTTGIRPSWFMASRQRGTPSDHTFFIQAESCTLGTDTTNPGGGPDAAMSGTGTNNYVRTSFASGTPMLTRLTWTPSTTTHTTNAQRLALTGTYRLIAVVRRSDSTSVITAQWARGNLLDTGPVVTLPGLTARLMIDLGTFTYQDAVTPGYSVPAPAGSTSVIIQAARASGTGTLDWDFLALIPADEQTLEWSRDAGFGGLLDSTYDLLMDSSQESVYLYANGGDPFAGTADFSTGRAVGLSISGSFPWVRPGQTNRFYVLTRGAAAAAEPQMDKTQSDVLTVNYWPRYLHVRPAST